MECGSSWHELPHPEVPTCGEGAQVASDRRSRRLSADPERWLRRERVTGTVESFDEFDCHRSTIVGSHYVIGSGKAAGSDAVDATRIS